ncbi:Uncharacterized protein PECH_003943 [Penicillium ucsense]|uniref:Phosphatidylinositol-specific phospholipase C X domain-containing protein n=1 Tax=Penicillium ucsense TaxID=2839758 RepID=A0A8J8VYK6_9EURO|nr:Uncharacterized protein PECM_008928 [Penicillium ucsense]KAF7728966.1 Uncharacterized protein PECH_003943 [Penicillium ucsense]
MPRLIWLLAALATSWAPAVLSSSLDHFALQKVLTDASPIFGDYSHTSTSKAEWMKKYPDDTLLVHMNIPGTHDSATWNYTQATQDANRGITELNQVAPPVPEALRCQQLPLIDMLNMGIRVFDLRYAFDPTNTSIIFYHSQGLLSETVSLDNVLFGFYRWLDDHPSEALFLSLQYEGSTAKYASNNAALQNKLFYTLTSAAARHYFVQTKNRLGTLGQARGKITLLRRFDLDRLPSSYTDSLPGLHFSPSQWEDNGVNISLTYNSKENLTAYIEDYYQPLTPFGSNATENIQWKYNATTTNLIKAAAQHQDSLFWTWASGTNTLNAPPDWPRTMALGNGSLMPSGGVNQRLLEFFKQQKGKRLGMVMFDFFDQPSELVDTFLQI